MLNSNKEVKALIRNGNVKEAIVLIDKLLTNNELSEEEFIELSFLKIRAHYLKGNYENGLSLIKNLQAKNKKKEDPLLDIDLLILHGSILFELGKFDEILQIVYSGEELLKNLGEIDNNEFLLRKSGLIFLKGLVFLIKGENQKTISFAEEVLDISKKINNKKGIANAKSQIAYIKREINKKDESISLYKEAIKIQEEIGDIYGKLISLKDLGTVYLYIGERKKAKEYYQKSFEIAKKIDNRNYLGRLYNNLGILEDLDGNLREAIEFYEKSIEMEKGKNIELVAKTLNNIGSVYIKMGNLEQALDTIERSLALFQEIGNVQNIMNSFNHLGRIYTLKGNYEKAMTNFQMSINMMDKIESKTFNSFTLFNFIKTATLQNKIKLAKEYLEILEQINEETKELVIYYRTIMAKALVLKVSTRARDRVKAEEYFEEIISSEHAHDELKTDAMLNLCDSKLIELKESKDSELLEEVKNLANDILEIAKKQNSMFLYAETYWFLSQIALIELDYESAKHLLLQAQLIAEEWDIRNLALKIALEHDKLIEKFDLWEQLIKNNASLAERIELVDIENFLTLIQDSKFEGKIIPEEPIMFMFLKKSGTPIYSRHYHIDDKLDDSLVSGFLAAINAFAKETFSSTGPIERIKHNNYTIIIQNFNPYIVCYIFYGQSYSALQRMIQIVDTIKKDEYISSELNLLSGTTNRLTKETEKRLNLIVDKILV